MTLTALRDDALASTPDGFALRLNLPWIRSLPVSSLIDLEVAIGGEPAPEAVAEIGDESGWWFIQDRVVIRGRRMLPAGDHDVTVSFRLAIPYLQAGPDGPLVLPFRIERSLQLDAPASASSVSRDVSGSAL